MENSKIVNPKNAIRRNSYPKGTRDNKENHPPTINKRMRPNDKEMQFDICNCIDTKCPKVCELVDEKRIMAKEI